MYHVLGYKNSMLWRFQYLLSTHLRRQVHFHRDIGWPVTHSEDVHSQLNVARNVLTLHILHIKHTWDVINRMQRNNLRNRTKNLKKVERMWQRTILTTLLSHLYKSSIKLTNEYSYIVYTAVLTCLNCTMMSLESSISLNIPSSLLVKAAPHSEEMPKSQQSVFTQGHLCCVLSVCMCKEVPLTMFQLR